MKRLVLFALLGLCCSLIWERSDAGENAWTPFGGTAPASCSAGGITPTASCVEAYWSANVTDGCGGTCGWHVVETIGPLEVSPLFWGIQFNLEVNGHPETTGLGSYAYTETPECVAPAVLDFTAGELPTCSVVEPEECSGSAADGVGDQFTSLIAPSGTSGDYCNAVSHCKMAVTSSVSIGGETVYTVKHTSEDCSAGADPPDSEEAEQGENCVSGSGGEFCLADQGENCGYVNDNFVCLSQIEDDGCAVFGDGSRVCGPNAPTPPVPDSGTAGQAAAADEEIEVTQAANTTTYNYYNSTTVAGSARPAGDSGDNPFDEDGDDGDGKGDGEEGDEGTASGGETCTAAPACDGDPIQCAVLAQMWRNRCVEDLTNSQLEDALGAGGEPADGPDEGTAPDLFPTEEIDAIEDFDDSGWLTTRCPSDVTIELGGDLPTVTVPISNWCEWMAIIGQLVMVAAYLGAARIVVGGV